MTRRLVAVLVPPPAERPGGFPGEALRAAMVEDVYETVVALELVETLVAVSALDPALATVEQLLWPGTEVLQLHGAQPAVEALGLMGDLGAAEATLVAGDAPDLPGLLVGKLHRALGSADVAVLPAATGGLVALATRCPAPGWLAGAGVDLDLAGALDDLRQRAPRRTAVSVGPGWHRMREPADLHRLDPGLEGWDATRALLSKSR